MSFLIFCSRTHNSFGKQKNTVFLLKKLPSQRQHDDDVTKVLVPTTHSVDRQEQIA